MKKNITNIEQHKFDDWFCNGFGQVFAAPGYSLERVVGDVRIFPRRSGAPKCQLFVAFRKRSWVGVG